MRNIRVNLALTESRCGYYKQHDHEKLAQADLIRLSPNVTGSNNDLRLRGSHLQGRLGLV